MSLQTITLSELQAPKANPRSVINTAALEGLADSIHADGLLQNLVVKPSGNKKTPFRIISGERRFRALQLLKKKGKIESDYAVAVEVRDDLSGDDEQRIATVENVQRENLPPMDEARAFKKLVHDGVTLEEIAAQTGVSASTITRRLALNNLCIEAEAALEAGEINLAQAEAVAIGKEEAQTKVLRRVVNGYGDTPDQIKDEITSGKPSKAIAIFDVGQYSGTFTSDLFADDESTFFDDVEQFTLLQEAAVKVLAASYTDKSDWVEITDNHSLRDWIYDEAPEGETGGVVINLNSHGEVEIKQGLLKTKADEETLDLVTESPSAPKKAKATYQKSLCAYIAHHKTLTVQAALLGNPRKAKEVAVVQLLGSKGCPKTIEWRPHKALDVFAKGLDKPVSYEALEGFARDRVGAIGEEIANPHEIQESAWESLAGYEGNEIATYEAVKELSDKELDSLLALLVVLPFGQRNCEELDSGNSLFNAVAIDLEIDMKDHWTPERTFLEKRNLDQLKEIAGECGFADTHSWLGSYKKGELVTALERFFAEALAADEPTDEQIKARNWLPEAFNFPAVNPDEERQEDETVKAA